MARISVVIPTYNRAEFIAQAIRSVQAQQYADLEIIVADDGSTDDTAKIVSQFGSPVIYVPLLHRGQPAATRNAGLRRATGEFIAFLDSDDIFLPGKFDLQLAAFQAHPEAGLVYSNGHFFKYPDKRTAFVLDGLTSPSGQVFSDLLRGNFLAPPLVLIRRDCFSAVGYFDERPDFFSVEDYDLWLRIAVLFPFVYAPGDVAAIRRHAKSISRDAGALRGRVLQVLQKMDEQYPELMREHVGARHEGYARNHGAVALAQLEEHKWLSAAMHALSSLSHLIRIPGLAVKVFVEWTKRRRLRANISA